MIKGGGDTVLDCIWRLCNTAFESGVVSEDWRSVVIVPLCKGKGEAFAQGGTMVIDRSMRRTQGGGIVKGWEDMRDRGRMPRKTRIT